MHLPSPLHIRTATPEDLPHILAFDSVVERFPGRKEMHIHAVRDGYTSLLFHEEVLIGFLILTYQLWGNGFIELLRVGEDHRGNGYGKLLIAYGESICTSPKLFISTNKSNDVMNGLLPKLGYLPSGHIENINEEPWDHELFYWKPVTTNS